MYREIQRKVECNILMDLGGIGDCVGTLPSIKYIYDSHPHVKIHFWVPDYFVEFAKLSLPVDKERLMIRGFSEKSKYKKELYARAFSIHVHTNLASHIVDHAYNVIVNKGFIEPEHKNYMPVRLHNVSLDEFRLPRQYVVVTTGFTAPVREFLPSHVNKVIQYIRSKGYSVVFLGKEKSFNGNNHTINGNFREEIEFNQGMNLINKTSLVQSAKIIQGAKTIVGLDNGLLHIAGSVGDIPIVGGFTTVDPKYRMPYRHNEVGWNYYPVTPPESLACRFCQSNWTFTYHGQDGKSQHDFIHCYYNPSGTGEQIACVKQLTAELYMEQLEKIL